MTHGGSEKRSGKVVPDAEDRSGERRGGAEKLLGKRRRKPRVLHPDLDGDGDGGLLVAFEQPGASVARGEAEAGVQDHRGDDQRAALAHPVSVQCDDDPDDEEYHRHGDGGTDPCRKFFPAEDPCVQRQSQTHRQRDHEKNALKHGPRGDLHRLTEVQRRQERREDDPRRRGAGGHGDGKGHVAPRQIGDHVGGRASGDGPHHHEADELFTGQRQRVTDSRRQQGHQQELERHARENGLGPFHRRCEVRRGKGGPHAQHDDPEERHDEAAQGREPLRPQAGEKRHQHRREGKDFDDQHCFDSD